MNRPLSKEDVRRLKRVFRMPAVQSMRSRKTSITNAFVSTIIPVVRPTPDEIADALDVLGMTADTVACAYCGDKCNAWDHLRPLVINRRPTGYISEIANLVPSCQPCNSSKTNAPWKEWILRNTGNSPTQRGIRERGGSNRAARGVRTLAIAHPRELRIHRGDDDVRGLLARDGQGDRGAGAKPGDGGRAAKDDRQCEGPLGITTAVGR